MKRIICILVCAFMLIGVGCTKQVPASTIKEGFGLCESNGGVEYITTSTKNNKVKFFCENGAVFEYYGTTKTYKLQNKK